MSFIIGILLNMHLSCYNRNDQIWVHLLAFVQITDPTTILYVYITYPTMYTLHALLYYIESVVSTCIDDELNMGIYYE